MHFTEYIQTFYKSEKWKGQGVKGHLCVEGTFIFQGSLEQGIICIFVDYFLHFCGYHLFVWLLVLESFQQLSEKLVH